MFTTARNTIGPMLACALLGLTLASQGCIPVLVYVITAYSDDGIVTVTAEIPKSASEVFGAAKKRIASGESEQGIPYTVIAIDEENYAFDLEAEDGSWRASFVVVPIRDDLSQIVARGTDDRRSAEESEHVVLKGIENLCRDLGVKYTVIGERTDG
jgi:hypothetical protein